MKIMRLLLSDVLAGQGYTVLEAADGDAALLLSQEHDQDSIHILVTDVVMPGMGGIDLAQKGREIHPDIRVLYTSGYAGDQPMPFDASDSSADFLQKPFDIDTLVRMVGGANGRISVGIIAPHLLI